MIWTSEADALLTSLWNEGGSLGFVANGLRKAGYKVSRSAVAGRKHRLLANAAKPIKPLGQRQRATNTVSKRPSSTRSNKMSEKKSVTISDIEAVAQNKGIEYLDLTPFSCKAILDGPRSGPWQLKKVCGLPRCEGSPYCRGHFRLYTNLQPPERRRHG